MASSVRVRYITRAIEKLVADGYLVARDQNDPDGPLVRCRIGRTYIRRAYHLQVLAIRDADGREQTIRVTDEHPFHVAGRGWTKAWQLCAGDVLSGAAGEASTVIANPGEDHPEGVTVYNLEVEDAHSYFARAEGSDAEPVWVHNANGSYTNLHASGKTYSGKGDINRANRSALSKAKKYRDPLVAQDWTPAATEADSFVQEAIRLRKHGGPGGRTYNKINSPGESILHDLGI